MRAATIQAPERQISSSAEAIPGASASVGCWRGRPDDWQFAIGVMQHIVLFARLAERRID